MKTLELILLKNGCCNMFYDLIFCRHFNLSTLTKTAWLAKKTWPLLLTLLVSNKSFVNFFKLRYSKIYIFNLFVQRVSLYKKKYSNKFKKSVLKYLNFLKLIFLILCFKNFALNSKSLKINNNKLFKIYVFKVGREWH